MTIVRVIAKIITAVWFYVIGFVLTGAMIWGVIFVSLHLSDAVKTDAAILRVSYAWVSMTLLGVLIVGIPTHIILSLCKARSLVSYLGFGMMLGGFLGGGVLLLFISSAEGWFQSMLACLSTGGICASVMWFCVLNRLRIS